jgi:hypothetical protein
VERGRAGDERLVEAGLILSSALSLPVILRRIVELAAEIASTPGQGTTVRVTIPR